NCAPWARSSSTSPRWPRSRRASPRSTADPGAGPAAASQQVYTCSMHPQVRLDRPGKCPICEMPLIPAASAQGSADGPPTMQLSEHAAAMASVETVAVERRELARELRTVGKVEFNESSLATITPRVDGYAERLFVNFTGVQIKQGDHLAEVYSPELLVAQQELLIALQGGDATPLVDTARTKLKLLGLTDTQVANLVEKKQLTERITLYSPISGTVIEKLVVDKAAFKAGEPLYRIANLETVWVYVDVYEYDLPWIRYGQKVSITAEALPGTPFSGMVTFVQPIVNEMTRTIRVPVHVENLGQRLKPGMFVSVVVHSALGPDGVARPTGVEGKHSCPMHPQVVQDTAGTCPICEMPLERIPGTPAEPPHQGHESPRFQCPMKCEKEKTYDQPGKCPVCEMALEPVKAIGAPGGSLAIPVTAVLDSGTRKLVYVEKSKGLFEPREIELGPRAGAFYPVAKGLAEGERVVTRGNFLIDSQFQITGHLSLLYPGGLHATMGHRHGGPATTTPPQPPPGKPDEHAGHKRR
ncbi:MAG TPA: efflux RND transporter periplasmic adaptor subunit, partial [Planctomycetota bacterium]|nr:efflux RND transporter periplasmic adaptor subunit [Planctomycetota bacterium]